MNTEDILKKINSFVTIKQTDRCVYTRDFDNVRYKIFREMKNVDPAFRLIASSPVLGGSYADNLKVSKPDEFDLVLQLDFPDHYLIQVEDVAHLPGFVTLRMSTLLKNIENEVHNRALYTRLQKLVDEDGYLVQARFHRWIQSIVDTVLNQFSDGMMFIDGELYYIRRRSTQGPAQTLDIEVDSRRFSIDFVPALRFPTSVWPAIRPCPPQGKNKPWIAIAKPLRDGAIGYDANNLYWSTSFVDQERYLIDGRYFLKPSIRLLKQLRDKYNLTNLKSYYIKTVFLWIVVEKEKEGDYNFGREGLGTTFFYGLEKLLNYLESQWLPFFWNDYCDMLDNLSQTQILDICLKFKAIKAAIFKFKDTNPARLHDIFLTVPQIESYEGGLINEERHLSVINEAREPSVITEEKKSDQGWCTIL